MRQGGKPAYVHYPKPGALAMRHGYLVNALRKKAAAQNSVTVIEAVGKELLKENGRVVGAKYQKKGDDTATEIRAPLVVVGDGHYSKLSLEFRATHQVLSEHLCIALLMKNYKFDEQHGKSFIEFSIGHPDAQLCAYQLNERETRSIIFVQGTTPSNIKAFCENRVVPNAPEHMKKHLLEAIQDGPRVVRCKRMAANFDTTPGVLILGDALNQRHPVTASGMTVALNDVKFWWDALLNKTDGLTDDEGILKQKLVFRKERQKWAFTINVFAEIAIRLISDHHPSTVILQQYFMKQLHDLAKENVLQKDKDPVYNMFGLTETDPKVLEQVLDGTRDGAIQQVYETKSYFSALWEAFQIRKKWKAITSDIMKLEAMT